MIKRPTLNFEKLFWSSGCEYVVGVDEAGVAPLAGPVVAAAVVLSRGTTLHQIPQIRDSKMLSPVLRKALYDLVVEKCFDYAVGIATPEEVDTINIHQATLLAQKRALEQLHSVEVVLVDGPHSIPEIKRVQFSVIGGDAKIASISAASIIAKVTRDLIMTDLHQQYPDYGFDRHKGYPTKYHYAQLSQFGPSPVHRKSFLKKVL